MNTFQKAVARIEQEAAVNGGYPAAIDLTKYDQTSFAHFYPHGDYVDHLRQRGAVIEWCRDRGIKVIDRPVRSGWPEASIGRALVAARPYRLGIKMGRQYELREGKLKWSSYGYLGWFIIWLNKRGYGGED